MIDDSSIIIFQAIIYSTSSSSELYDVVEVHRSDFSVLTCTEKGLLDFVFSLPSLILAQL